MKKMSMPMMENSKADKASDMKQMKAMAKKPMSKKMPMPMAKMPTKGKK